MRVPIISKENCQLVPFPYFRGGLTARMFCAGFIEGKKDACQVKLLSKNSMKKCLNLVKNSYV